MLLGLDLLGLIKLVNFVRLETKEGRGESLDLSARSAFEDDRFLQPVMEGDALLYSLEDIIETGVDQEPEPTASRQVPSSLGGEPSLSAEIAEVRQTLLRTQQAALATQQRLELAELALSAQKGGDSEIHSSAPPKSHGLAVRPKYEGNYDGPGQ